MKNSLLSCLVVFVLCSSLCFADAGKKATNSCNDPGSWQQWHELLKKYPEDDALCALYATRRGLCSMIEAGQIDIGRATRIIERMRTSLMEMYREQERREQEEEKRDM